MILIRGHFCPFHLDNVLSDTHTHTNTNTHTYKHIRMFTHTYTCMLIGCQPRTLLLFFLLQGRSEERAVHSSSRESRISGCYQQSTNGSVRTHALPVALRWSKHADILKLAIVRNETCHPHCCCAIDHEIIFIVDNQTIVKSIEMYRADFFLDSAGILCHLFSFFIPPHTNILHLKLHKVVALALVNFHPQE